ncbi:hypothetical protein RHIZ404_220749 [Rhizobium sp. EC-SD404]|nr:hypothetical protein RHIZ404_220749 [Rhizobium sp. EC-SD404]
MIWLEVRSWKFSFPSSIIQGRKTRPGSDIKPQNHAIFMPRLQGGAESGRFACSDQAPQLASK